MAENKGRSEGYAKWNKEKYTEKQKWRKANQDSNQHVGAEGRNNHSTRTNEETRIQKNKEKLICPGQLWMFQHLNHKGARKRKGRARNGKLIWKNNERKFPQSGKGNRLPGSPGSSESPKVVGPKEAHTKAQHNYITQD